MKDTDKRALKFLAGFSSNMLSLLGWACAGIMSSNKYVWLLIIPILMLCACVNSLAITSWISK